MRGIKIIYLIVSFILVNKNAFSQAEKCDTIYSYPDSLAFYKGGNKSLLEFVRNELIPVIQLKCDNEIEKISSLKIRLIINNLGEVIDAKLIQPNPDDLSTECEKEICSKFLELDGFKAASNHGIHVCSYYTLPISCIKWN